MKWQSYQKLELTPFHRIRSVEEGAAGKSNREIALSIAGDECEATFAPRSQEGFFRATHL